MTYAEPGHTEHAQFKQVEAIVVTAEQAGQRWRLRGVKHDERQVLRDNALWNQVHA